ncbi:MAG: chemotaxis protein CheA [Deltaproteobacteria bacterium]|nr:chemotaxis protein CheA [Deltaproteobacteria bacterium]
MNIAKYRKMFITEAAEHLQTMAEQLVRVDADPEDRDGIDALFREAHSIKGMAATMSFDATARLAHHLEDQLSDCREQGQIDSGMIDRLLAGVDLLEGLLEDIRSERPEREVDGFIKTLAADLEPVSEAPDPDAEPVEPERNRLRIHLRLADTVTAPGPRLLVLLKRLAEFGPLHESTPGEEQLLQGEISRTLSVQLETAVSQAEIHQCLQRYRELTEITFPSAPPEEKSRKRSVSSSTSVRVGTDLLDRFINLTGELITNRYLLQGAASEKNWQELNEGLGQLARLVKDLHHQVLQVRMMPLASVTGRLPRAVRELCRSSGKEVQFTVEGASIELDRAILEALNDPLLHMIRNAIDHGIEARGSIKVKAWRERDQVLIQVVDDGCGIDPEQIRQQAVQRNLISPDQAQTLRKYDIFQLICLPGFSTAGQVTETSGRGVGMDVVKTAVERLGGVLLIDSTPGQGARITMKLPLSVAIIRVLLIDCAGSLMGVPISRVLQTLEVSPQEVQTSGKQLVISLHGEAAAVVA